MSRIDGILAELAPSGVAFRSLGEVLKIKNGKDHKSLGDGPVPVYGSGGILRHVDTAAADGPSVLIPRKGSLGNVFYVEGPFWVVDTIFRTEIDRSQLEPRFLYHQLLTMRLGEMNQAGGVPSQTQTVLSRLRIPVPPLEVQREIVRILDQFTQLEAELEAELEARRRQYEHYRSRILSEAAVGAERAALEDLGRIITGRTPKSADTASWGEELDFVTPTDIKHGMKSVCGTARRLSAGGAAAMAKARVPAGSLLVTCIGADMGKTVINVNDCITNQQINAIIPEAEFHVGYLFHVLTEMRQELRRQGERGGGTMPQINKSSFSRIQVPMPTAARQQEIAEVLDSFDTLAHDLRVGLPAEINARRKQYEYYRERLLTFKELMA